MNMDEILTLVQAVSDSKLTSFKLDQGDMHISLKKEKEEAKIITVSAPGRSCSGFNRCTCTDCSFHKCKHRNTCCSTRSSRTPGCLSCMQCSFHPIQP